MTYDDLVALPDDGLRHELIDGEHFVTPSPASRHQIILANLFRLIGPHTHATKCGVTLFAPYDIVFTPYDVVEPDLMYFSRARYAQVVTEKNAQGAPDLVVEILSPGTRRRDEGLKRRLYERMEVGEFWIVDPAPETIKVDRLIDGSYRQTTLTRATAATLTTPLLPGLNVPLADVFEMP
ncbi:MAG: Uma2 family endonuclease [Acidobacteria bacterium]|nr:Uma2 family endonuclease [Acidobacteriota bacterium]